MGRPTRKETKKRNMTDRYTMDASHKRQASFESGLSLFSFWRACQLLLGWLPT